MPDKKRDKNPLFGAAVLKLTFTQRHAEQSPQFTAIYHGVLRDLGVSDDDVDRYLEQHRAEVQKAISGKGRRGS